MDRREFLGASVIALTLAGFSTNVPAAVFEKPKETDLRYVALGYRPDVVTAFAFEYVADHRKIICISYRDIEIVEGGFIVRGVKPGKPMRYMAALYHPDEPKSNKILPAYSDEKYEAWTEGIVHS